MNMIFFCSCLAISVGVDAGELVKIEISLKSNATKSVPLYVNTNDSFLIIAQSSLVKFLSRALLIVKITSTEPQATSCTVTSDLEICSSCVSAAIKLSLKSSLFVMTLQLALNFTRNASVISGEVVLGFEDEDSRMLDGAIFVPV